MLTPEQTRLLAVASLARAIRTLASIDMFFIFMYTLFFSPLFIGAAWGAFFGYMSGKEYSCFRAKVYAFYYIIKVCFDAYLVVNFSTFFYLFGFMVDAFICSVVVRYCRILETLEAGEIARLREGGAAGIVQGGGRANGPGLPIFVVQQR